MNYVAGDLRDQLAYVGHAVVQAGLVVGSGGNLSARAADSDECWVTAAGTWLDRLTEDSFVRVRITDGAVLDSGTGAAAHSRTDATALDSGVASVDGAGPLGAAPTSELALHLATYRARPDVNAVVHLHPQAVLLLDAIGEPIRLVTTDHAFYLRHIATIPFSPPGGAEVGVLAAAACVDGANCVVLSHHGCSVIADSVELAHKRASYLEEAARLTYRALTLGREPAGCPIGWLASPGATA